MFIREIKVEVVSQFAFANEKEEFPHDEKTIFLQVESGRSMDVLKAVQTEENLELILSLFHESVKDFVRKPKPERIGAKISKDECTFDMEKFSLFLCGLPHFEDKLLAPLALTQESVQNQF